MKLLDCYQQTIPLGTKDSSTGEKHCTIVKPRGTIDIGTLQIFETTLSELLEQNFNRLILNLTDLEYISSSGIGALIKYAQKYRDSSGDIKLTHIPPHIWDVFNMVGINNVFETFNSDKDAVASIQESESYKDDKQLRYPAKFKCPSCQAILEISKPAKYRCQHCDTYFAADKDGKVKAFLSRKYKAIEIKLSGSSDNTLWLESLIKSQSQWLNFSEQEIQEFSVVINETWKICSANGNRPWHTFRITLLIEGSPSISSDTTKDIPPKITVGIISFENLGVARELLTNDSLRQKVTNIEVLPLLPNGELIKITKISSNGVV
ncbi:MAG: anti-sigma factor antagonist [Planctomycetota bacterium]